MAILTASLVLVTRPVLSVCQYSLLGLDTVCLLGFWACPGRFQSSPEENIPFPSQVGL